MVLTDSDDLVSNKMQEYIVKLLKKMNIENYNINITPGSLRGDNYLGIIANVKITGEDENGKNVTLNLIVKSAPKNEAFRTLAPVAIAYDREIYLYSKVFPEFKKFQEEKGILKPLNSFAKYYESTMDDLNEALIMENMKEIGFELWDRHKPLNYGHVLLVLREYGKLHALSYALKDQKPELYKKLSDNCQETFFQNMDFSDSTRKYVREQSERALNSLDPVKHKEAYNRFKDYQDRMIDLLLDVVKTERAGKYGVIRHGDCWINNILFKYEDTRKQRVPTNMCLLDWQLSHVGSPALDLAYFIFTATDKKLRDQHYDNMIQQYYDSLCSFLRELGSDPEVMLPFSILQEHLKKFSVFGLYMSIMLLHLMTSDMEEIPDVHNVVSTEDAMSKFVFNSKNKEKYNERISGVILDFVKFDYEF